MQIRVKNIRTEPVIGVYDFERHQTQPIILNLTIDFDPGNSFETDDIEDTLDYCEMTKTIVKKVNETRFELLEKLVHYVADYVLAQKLVQTVTVEADKPEALKDWAESVSLTVTKTR